jgi:hypothetical protein
LQHLVTLTAAKVAIARTLRKSGGGRPRVSATVTIYPADFLPAIDADLNAGLIDEKEARRRRKYLEDESDFFGAMDGASRSCAATPSPACSSC